jgi:chloride channel protein, CIC family
LFKLDEDERRIAVAAGLGAGIGSIFKVPLGGGIFSAEVFYRRDFEIRALIPGFCNRIYNIWFCLWMG